MMPGGRGIARMLVRSVQALERMAAAQEELNQLAKAEREIGEQIENQPGIPFCPHCSRVDPRIRTQSNGSGPMSEFVLVMQCANCGSTFYGLPEGWQIAPDIETAHKIRNARQEGAD